ncbi:MAG: TonB-dependent receptor plug domain-containing protein, partial [Marinifilaceae bacterium]
GPQKWQMHTLNASLSKCNVLYDHASMVASFQDYEESRHDRKLNKDNIRERTEKVNVYSFNADFEKRINENDILYYGGEWTFNNLNSKGHERNIQTGEKNLIGSRYPDDSEYNSLAFYTNYKKVFSDQLTLNGGIRYSWIRIDAQLDPTFYEFPFQNLDLNTGAFNGSLGVVYHPEPSWEIKMNASSGFRAPNIDDIGKVFDSEPGKVVVPNADLDPEFAYNLDLGVKKNFNDRVIVELSGFYTLLKDALVRRDFTFNGETTLMYDGVLSEVQAIVNADEAKIYGLYFGTHAQLFGPLTFRSHLNLTHGELEDGSPVRHVPPMFGSMHLEYLSSKFKTELYTLFNGKLENKDLASSEQDKPHIYALDKNGDPYSPGWMTLNFRSTYNLTSKIRMNLALENICNKRYRPYSSGIVAPGRNLILGLEWRI